MTKRHQARETSGKPVCPLQLSSRPGSRVLRRRVPPSRGLRRFVQRTQRVLHTGALNALLLQARDDLSSRSHTITESSDITAHLSYLYKLTRRLLPAKLVVRSSKAVARSMAHTQTPFV